MTMFVAFSLKIKTDFGAGFLNSPEEVIITFFLYTWKVLFDQ